MTDCLTFWREFLSTSSCVFYSCPVRVLTVSFYDRWQCDSAANVVEVYGENTHHSDDNGLATKQRRGMYGWDTAAD